MKIENIADALSYIRLSNKAISICITGGGTELIPTLLSTGGMSAVFDQAFVPYSEESLERFLGAKPAKNCSKETAKLMSDKLASLNSTKENRVFVSITASLAKRENERIGRVNEAYINLSTDDNSKDFCVIFVDDKDAAELNSDIAKIYCPELTMPGSKRRFQESMLGILCLNLIFDFLKTQ